MPPKNFQIKHHHFRFGKTWRRAVSFDETPELQKVKVLEGTKDMDIVAVRSTGDLFLIEVTDFRGYEEELEKKIDGKGLALETAQKTRDTLAALVGAVRTCTDRREWEPYAKALTSAKTSIRIVLWLEEDRLARTPYQARRTDVGRGVLKGQLEKMLKWLTSRVIIESNATYDAGALDMDVSCPTGRQS